MSYPTVREALEALMLISFSVSWYWSIMSMLRTGQAAEPQGRKYLVCQIHVGAVVDTAFASMAKART